MQGRHANHGFNADEEKAARIANSAAKEGRNKVSKRGGKSSKYDDMNKEELYKRAKKVGIKGRSDMSKSELRKALVRSRPHGGSGVLSAPGQQPVGPTSEICPAEGAPTRCCGRRSYADGPVSP
ncbi:DUF7218 family protein [Pseudonocardia sp. Cha107L01]|uniref:DUF7218 family protein n=1 Tax=Pseudonocardia sp. Cha107L01 TaxID=3457576 RepID=UPI00403E5F27